MLNRWMLPRVTPLSSCVRVCWRLLSCQHVPWSSLPIKNICIIVCTNVQQKYHLTISVCCLALSRQPPVHAPSTSSLNKWKACDDEWKIWILPIPAQILGFSRAEISYVCSRFHDTDVLLNPWQAWTVPNLGFCAAHPWVDLSIISHVHITCNA